VRQGESTIRDEKLRRGAEKKKNRGCSAGGECGLPDIADDTYGPILNWTTCNVWDWLYGTVVGDEAMRDIFAITRKLHDIYDVKVDRDVFEWSDPVFTSARFGCIGCPAIESSRFAPASSIKKHGGESPLNELYDVWFEARRRDNRCEKIKEGKDGRGPIRMEVRKKLFDRVIDIQRRAGVVLVGPEDEAFIRDCWRRKVYPRGWSEADEATESAKLPGIQLIVLNNEIF
jgi:3'-phosphoadenosine 5'-phosphosulfate sulfotransferase (PAPS reductase)/FAD synthetase